MAFNSPKAKIDFITIGDPTWAETSELAKGRTEGWEWLKQLDGTLKTPETPNPNWFLCIHDPSCADVQAVVDHLPDSRILALEVAMDFFLRDGSNNSVDLARLHHWLQHRITPSTSAGSFVKKRYDHGAKTYVKDHLVSRHNGCSLVWQGRRMQLRCYIKTKEKVNGQLVAIKGPHHVRLEITLLHGGEINVHRLGMLPPFIPVLRKQLGKYLRISRGIHRPLKRNRSKNEKISRSNLEKTRQAEQAWLRSGAAGAIARGDQLRSDAAANRAIGEALRGLSDKLDLSLPEKVGDYDAWYAVQSQLYQATTRQEYLRSIEGVTGARGNDNHDHLQAEPLEEEIDYLVDEETGEITFTSSLRLQEEIKEAI